MDLLALSEPGQNLTHFPHLFFVYKYKEMYTTRNLVTNVNTASDVRGDLAVNLTMFLYFQEELQHLHVHML